MPDKSLARSLLKTCWKLAPKHAKRANQANLRRAISTAYFASFHALARVTADCLVGAKGRPKNAWIEAYRGLAHGPCKKACEDAAKVSFPDCLAGFADIFIQLQDARKRADYDPTYRPTLEEAHFFIELADVAIHALKSAERYDKVAFSTWVLITSPGAQQARKIVREGGARTILQAPG
ncbi:hypothetical protein [Aliiroseovarius lamellibrachiae]|uniref:hypothetical protein n=1 Tax=Aliiroseovarius lamellibrachiae TaxID=1924933 RepID=UPI001BE11615|nr:hypothetical protein [Aliiroseovarius lamellibrachiae]MBT2129650.1 hypothetical protein [Aliiroseovarius lamellibrachiae]